jgi:hypothetical protein
MPDDAPEPPAVPEAPRQELTPEPVVNREEGPTAPVSGRRSSFRDIRRQLTDEELKQTGAQKLIIEDFERAASECDVLRGYIQRYHEADKQVAVLTEKLKINVVMEILYAMGLAIGGAMISFAPSLTTEKGDTSLRNTGFIIGFLRHPRPESHA